MRNRDHLNSRPDQLPEEMLQPARVFLGSLLRPRTPQPEIERSRDRGRNFRKLVEQGNLN